MRIAVCIAIALVCSAAAGGCKKKKSSASEARTDKLDKSSETAQRPSFRLDDRAAPTRYEVRLALDPAKPRFDGEISIGVEISRPTSELWMHGRDFEITSATLQRGDQPALTAAIERGEKNGLLGFRFERPLEPGPAVLALRYTGAIVERDGAGIFVEREAGASYLYTQFEPLDARRAFPCFDEPRWKVPWRLTLDIPADLVAVANTPVEATEAIDGGQRRVRFVETKPLPTYLVAFGVGPFDAVDAGVSAGGAPIRIVTPKGRGAEARYAAEVTPEILALLEAYFGRPYPYRKLDTLIIPTTQGFGAMEHPGLVTFASRLALWKPDQDAFTRRRRFALVQAHELGHQWFGNLVTMPWWDDIWLNEAFASWIENRVLADWRPAWKLEAVSMSTKERAMAADSLATARRIREPIADESGIESAFDGITYQKGEAVIRMFESWLGAEVWQRSIRAYLERYAWKTATADDLLAVVGETAGVDAAAPFNSFLEQNGLPLIEMKLRCEAGAAPVLQLAQRRYLPLGSKGERDRRWRVPVCVTHSGGEGCAVLAKERGELPLGEAGAPCPSWVNPNRGGVGYYRSAIDPALLEKAELSLAERLSSAGDVVARLRAGLIDPKPALDRASALIAGGDPALGLAAIDLLEALHELAGDGDNPAFAAAVRVRFAPALARIGLAARRGESPLASELRGELIVVVAAIARDAALQKKLVAMARAHLGGGARIDPAISAEVLEMAARHGDAALLEAMKKAAASADNRIARRELLEAIGHFRGELAAPALAFALSDDIDGRSASRVLGAAAGWPDTREAAVAFVEANIEALGERLSESGMADLPDRFDEVCDRRQRDRLDKLFAEHTATLPGGAQELAKALERMDLCIAFRAAQGPALDRALGSAQTEKTR
jgi:alanyl aminopeptidase